jgi:predicted porin
MNKKLLATAVGLVLAGGMGLASADVKLYGQLDVSVDGYENEDTNDDDTNLRSNTSAIGVKGSEDLGNGMEAFFKVEYQTDLANDGRRADGTTNDGWTGRDQYIGLGQESVGKLAFGTMSTAYKAQSAKIDPFYRTSIQARTTGLWLQSALHSGKGEEGQGRATNTIGYSSPNWSGFGLLATYTLDSDENDFGPGDARNDDDDPWSVGASYSGLGGLYAFVSYVTTNSSGDDDATQIGAQYAFGDFEVHGIYEIDGGLITLRQYGSADGTNVTAGSGDGADVWSVGGSWTIGNNVIGADYGQGDEADDPTVIADDYKSYRIAAYHKFSDRTRVYVGYAGADRNDADDVTLWTVGARHNF